MRVVTTKQEAINSPAPVAPGREPAPFGPVLTAREHAQAALIAGGFAAGGVLALGGAVMFYAPAMRSHWPDLVVVAGLIGGGTTAFFGLAWVRTAAIRAWSVDDQERWRRWGIEDELRQAAQQTDPAPVLQPVSPAERVRLAGFEMLVMHAGGRECTREEMQAVGVSQRDWNAANAVLQAVGIKSKKGWTKVDYAEALRLYQGVRFKDGHVWVMEPGGKGGRRVDF